MRTVIGRMAAADTLELLAGIRQHAAMGFVAPSDGQSVLLFSTERGDLSTEWLTDE